MESEIQTEHVSTDYGALVLQVLARMRPASGTIDQALLRQCIALSSSHLVTDATTNTDGLDKWLTGFSRVVDVVVALHQRDELELETLSAASKACSECWSISGSYRGLEGSREGVRNLANKLKRVLDENGKTYKGQKVYAP